MKHLAIFCMISLFTNLFGCQEKEPFRSVDAATFSQEIANPAMQLIDVRTAAEYAEGHIPGATLMDVGGEAFDTMIQTLDEKRPVALYCRSGRRSKLAAERVAKAGYEVVELDGGILSWEGEIAR